MSTKITLYDLKALSRECTRHFLRMKEQEIGSAEFERCRAAYEDAERRLKEMEGKYYQQPGTPKRDQVQLGVTEVSDAVN